jgi:GcrA cell cycle regulator
MAGVFTCASIGPAYDLRSPRSDVLQGFLYKERNMVWSQKRIELLIQMWSDGYSAGAIAERLGGVTPSAVCGKVYRLGLPHRETKIHLGSGPTKKSVASRVPRTPPLLARPTVDTPKKMNPPSVEIHSAAAETRNEKPVRNHVRSRDEEEAFAQSRCRWPIGDPREPGFHFCESERLPGRSYCSFHHRLSISPVQPASIRRSAMR